MNESCVSEVQGSYGLIKISESLIQSIWAKQDFSDIAVSTDSGKVLKILDPGVLNTYEGPDFKNAKLDIGGEVVIGDVEIHFYKEDWTTHQHHLNPNFDNVILHVIVFPGKNDVSVQTKKGSVLETLCLVEYLKQDLEEYAVEYTLLGDDHPYLSSESESGSTSQSSEIEELINLAKVRWNEKLKFVSKRLETQDWSESCHQYCLEVLGYSRNKAPMFNIGNRHSLSEFSEGYLSVETLFEEEKLNWRQFRIRPQNHPRLRLEQYIEIVLDNPDWPEDLLSLLASLKTVSGSSSTVNFRKLHELKQLRESIKEDVFKGVISGSRLDTLICDALLPLYSIFTEQDTFAYWFHWYAGDITSRVKQLIATFEIEAKAYPYSNGLNQAALLSCLNKSAFTCD